MSDKKLETAIRSCDARRIAVSVVRRGVKVGASIGAFVAGIGFRRWEIKKSFSNFQWRSLRSKLFRMGRTGRKCCPRSLARHSVCIPGLCRLAFGFVDRHVRSAAGECSGEGECPLATRRLLDYELAVTTAVKKATVMIRINIVMALKASVVISLLLPPVGGDGRSGRPLGSPG